MVSLSEHPRYRLAAVVSRAGRVISVGVNKVSAPKRFTKQRPGMHLHAEIAALFNLPKDQAKGAVITIAGITAAGNQMNTKPCRICENAIESMGLKRIVYLDGNIVKELK